MKIWSKPYSDMRKPLNYNGPKVKGRVHDPLPLLEVIPRSAVGYMLETPSIRRYRFAVTMRPVRTISRKGWP